MEAKGLFEQLTKVLAAEVEKIEREKAEIERDKRELEEIRKKMTKLSKEGETKIELDVGGTHFVTSISTLVSSETGSLLANTFVTGTPFRQKDGSIFIDRDPKMFHLILEFLRKGKINLDGLTTKETSDLRDEAQYYRLPGLEAAISENEARKKSMVRTTQMKILESIASLPSVIPVMATPGGAEIEHTHKGEKPEPAPVPVPAPVASPVWEIATKPEPRLKIEGMTVKQAPPDVTRLVVSPKMTFASGDHFFTIEIDFIKGPASIGVISSDSLSFARKQFEQEMESQPAAKEIKQIGLEEGQWGICEDGRFWHAGSPYDTGQPPFSPNSRQKIFIRLDIDLGVLSFTRSGITWSATVPRGGGGGSISLAVIGAPYCSYTLILQ